MPLTTTYAPTAMVASVDHLASTAGAAMLRDGGNAVDAAIAASAVLAVTSPHLCGMGGDLFALVHRPGDAAPAVLNASGRAGSGADPDRLRGDGHATMPAVGDVRTAPVPGCVDGWLALHDRFGRLPFATILEPAIGYAANGFPCSPLLAFLLPELRGVAGAEGLVGDGRRPGDLLDRPGVAAALRAIVREGRAGFYGGAFGEGLLALGGGEYTPADLEVVQADWVEPLVARVWEHDVWTVPANSQGYLTLLGLRLAEGLDRRGDLGDDPTDARWAHALIEAARAAGHDRTRQLHEHADTAPLLGSAEVERRLALIGPDARTDLVAPSGAGDTMYLCAVDADRMGVSLIQSNASGFGCHVFEPATGIGLHNRGIGFSLVAGHPAEYGPGRRPPHTLSPALVTRPDHSLRSVVGTMGGDTQPQILLQVITRLLRHGQSAGACIDRPRWALSGEGRSRFDTWAAPDAVIVDVESSGASWHDGLVARGHPVRMIEGISGSFGHAQLIEVRPDGGLGGAADPRALISAAVGF